MITFPAGMAKNAPKDLAFNPIFCTLGLGFSIFEAIDLLLF